MKTSVSTTVVAGVVLAGGVATAVTLPLKSATDSSTPTTTSVRFFDESTPSTSTQWSYAKAEVGLRFSSSTEGEVTGISFYKNKWNYGPHTGNIYDANGSRLASVKFLNETPSGWQYSRLTSPIKVTPGQTYYVSYVAPYGRYSYTKAGNTAPRVRGPLATSANAGMLRTWKNGVATTLPTADNYWVDVHVKVPSAPAPAAPTAGRDMYQQPFSSRSIWNMPIGSEAQYRPLRLTPPTTAYGVVRKYLVFDQSAPLRKLVDRGYWWPWTSGDDVPGTATGVSVRIPDSYVIDPPPAPAFEDRPSAALQADGLAREFQYTVRPTPGSDISMFEGARAAMDLRGDGLTPNGQSGGHGGSGLTAIGGTLRQGELTGDEPIRHALSVTFNLTKWGTKQGGKIENGFRWPALWADYKYDATGFATGYGTLTSSGFTPRDGLGAGSLLAIPADVDLGQLGFETKAGAKLAWTYQNYGAYVVDNAGDNGSYDVFRHNVEDRALQEFPDIDTGYSKVADTPFGRDMNKIFTRLAVVDNNGPDSIGGGGTPRQPLAAPLKD